MSSLKHIVDYSPTGNHRICIFMKIFPLIYIQVGSSLFHELSLLCHILFYMYSYMILENIWFTTFIYYFMYEYFLLHLPVQNQEVFVRAFHILLWAPNSEISYFSRSFSLFYLLSHLHNFLIYLHNW